MATAKDIIEDALRKIGVVAQDEPMTADQVASGLRELNRFLKSLENRGAEFYREHEVQVILTNQPRHDIACPVRRVLTARLVRGDIETPMQELTRQEYDTLPVKNSTGLPTTFWFKRAPDVSTIFVWPVLASPNGEFLRMSCEMDIPGVSEAGHRVDIPPEWEDAVVYGLGARLAETYGQAAPLVVARAEEELRLALSRDCESSIFFRDC